MRDDTCLVRGRLRRRTLSARCPALAVLGLLSLALVTCDNYDFYGLISGTPSGSTGGALSIIPLSVTLVVNSTFTFRASGGTPPYRFSVTGSGTIDPGTGVYTAPGVPSSDAVQVSDSVGHTPAEAWAVSVPP